MPAESGQADAGAGYALTLAKDVKLPYPPERAPGKDTYAAVVNVPKLEPGLYQITLSGEAWIDVAQNGALVKSSDFSGQRDCPGVRKTVRFDLAAGPATIADQQRGRRCPELRDFTIAIKRPARRAPREANSVSPWTGNRRRLGC